jgi:hypothetical protein
MPKIYASSITTVVWLGEADAQSSSALSIINAMATSFRSRSEQLKECFAPLENDSEYLP